MKFIKLKCLMALLILCFLTVFINSACKSIKKDPYVVDGQVLKDLLWKQDVSEEIKIQWKFLKGTRAIYYETQKVIVSSKEKETEQEHSLTLEYYVKEVFNDGTAQVILSGKDLSSKGKGYELLSFLLASSSELGSFTRSPSGQMKNVKGMIDIRSLPTFPDNSLRIGSKWTSIVSLAFAPTLQDVIATGKCNYHLIGMADVDGHRWTKINFEADVEQPKQETVIEKIIGVKWAEKPTEKGQDVVVVKTIPGTPAAKAGILPGDEIISFSNMDINSWSDLASAISLSSCDKLIPMIVIRNKERKSLVIKPQASLTGQMESKGNIKGTIIFDVTQGVLINMEINPFIIRSSFIVDEKTTEIKAHVECLTQFYKLDYNNNKKGE